MAITDPECILLQMNNYLCLFLVSQSGAFTPSDKFMIWSEAVQKVEKAITANITKSVLASKEEK